MIKKFRRKLLKMFREFLVYHNSSLEFRAKILTLMIASDEEINECEEKKLREIAYKIYADDDDRAELLIDTVKEYFDKIRTNNGLNFEHLIVQVEREMKEVKRFAGKIDTEILEALTECMKNEDDKIFHQRIIEFLEGLKKEYGTV
ncbi:MAG: hypothetical protein U9Q90_03875 [Campylobacterota bacterium]|nr:hypothetical protein [Campylobacterota bacterium]